MSMNLALDLPSPPDSLEGDQSIPQKFEDFPVYPPLPLDSLSNGMDHVKMQDEEYHTPPPMVSYHVPKT